MTIATLSQQQLQLALVQRTLPTIQFFNRLEGRPRTPQFDRALRTELRDALWMLTRQWQLGEFRGDDAGSPLSAQLELATTNLNHVTVGGVGAAYSDATPLEAVVERQPVTFARAGSKLHLDLRVQLGRYWNKLLASQGFAGYQAAYRIAYPFALPVDDGSDAAADAYAHADARAYLAALAGRATDGGELYLYLKTAGHHASDKIALASPGDGPKLDAIGPRLVAWFDAQYMQPAGPTAWQPASLDHAVTASAPTGKTVVADGYPGGHLDWYSFDTTAGASIPAIRAGGLANLSHGPVTARPNVKAFIPAPLVFDGMPNTRWWKFEDSKVSFGEVTPATTDVGKLLTIEFALVYANDWFLIPCALPSGSLANVRGLTVTNSFGEKFWINAAGNGPAAAWNQWRMFTLTPRDSAVADTTLFLAPAVPKIQSGDPLDEIYFVRDEMADLVWGIETRVPLISGTSRDGATVGRETRNYHQRKASAAAVVPYVAPIYYQSQTSVAEHWIPFLPVHVPGSNREIQLQRGGMHRRIDGLAVAKVEAQTTSLRPGVDTSPRQPYFVHEEEIPRAGTRVTRAFQRTRWRGGSVFTWIGMAAETGRGEDRSRLGFDQIPPAPRR